jgi:hypothetical protein
MRKIVSLGAGAALVLGLGLAVPLAAKATTATTVVVTNSDLVSAAPSAGEFVVINQGSTASAAPINVTGPATPPLGQGSLQMSVSGTSDHWSVYNYDHMGTPLSAITALSYSTYTDNTTTAPALQMEINPGSPSPAGMVAGCPTKSYSTLNFEPYLNSGGTLASHTWQSWNVLSANGVVWGTGITACAPASYTGISWATLLSYYPNATIKYGFGVNVGSSWSAMTGNADALTIGTSALTTTYNFEPNNSGSAASRPFKSAGSGTETNLSGADCQFTAAGCVVESNGTATSSHLGTGPYTSDLRVDWASHSPNPDVTGASCAPANGTGTLTAANGDTLTQFESGTVCETAASAPNVPHSFTGSFFDTGGTGRFAGATGSGTITGGDDGAGNSNYTETGTISY